MDSSGLAAMMMRKRTAINLGRKGGTESAVLG